MGIKNNEDNRYTNGHPRNLVNRAGSICINGLMNKCNCSLCKTDLKNVDGGKFMIRSVNQKALYVKRDAVNSKALQTSQDYVKPEEPVVQPSKPDPEPYDNEPRCYFCGCPGGNGSCHF